MAPEPFGRGQTGCHMGEEIHGFLADSLLEVEPPSSHGFF